MGIEPRPDVRSNRWSLSLRSVPTTILRIYLTSALALTTIAVLACFVWYKQEYDLAYKLDRSGKTERAEVHRTNSLWLGLWGGVYGLTGVTAAAALLKDAKKSE